MEELEIEPPSADPQPSEPEVPATEASAPDAGNAGVAEAEATSLKAGETEVPDVDAPAPEAEEPASAAAEATDAEAPTPEAGELVSAEAEAPSPEAGEPEVSDVVDALEAGESSGDAPSPEAGESEVSDVGVDAPEAGESSGEAPSPEAGETEISDAESSESDEAEVGATASQTVSIEEWMASAEAAVEEPPKQESLEDAQLLAVLEACVYVAEEPLMPAQIAAALNQDVDRIRDLLSQLVTEFERPEHGICIKEVAGGFKMSTKPEHHEAVRNFARSLKAPLKLSLPALETLAVIAYKQPVTTPEIMEIRGVQGGGVLKTLLDRKLITEAGRKNVIGKPILFKTTKEFLIQFGLKDLAELPSLKEFEEIRRMAMSDSEVPAGAPQEGTAEQAEGAASTEPQAEPKAETTDGKAEALAIETAVIEADEPAVPLADEGLAETPAAEATAVEAGEPVAVQADAEEPAAIEAETAAHETAAVEAEEPVAAQANAEEPEAAPTDGETEAVAKETAAVEADEPAVPQADGGGETAPANPEIQTETTDEKQDH